MLLTVRVSGTGNVKLFPPPKVEIPWAALVKADERVQVDSLARRIRGAKEFDWVLTPRIAGELDLPPIRYGYFNPDTRRYELASSNGARVSVATGTLASADTARAVALLSLRTQYRGPLAPPPYQRGYFWVLLAVAPLPAIAGRLRGGRRRVAPRPAWAALRALARNQTLARDARHLRRTFTTALAERLGLHAETFTRPDALARALRRAGVSADVATDAERFLRQLDEAAYSSGGLLPADAALRAQALFRAADTEALARPELRLPRIFGLIVAAALPIVTGTLAASSADGARRDFARGVAAYRTHHYAAAATAFRSAAQSEPWAADAWANLGTAAWAATDTASAVVGWQRALRLEPGAFDARDRLDLMQSSTFGTNGFVPPVSSTAVLWTALVLWWIAWVLSVPLAFARLTHPAMLRRWAYAAGTVSVFLLLTALDLDQRLAGRDLGVVRSTARLRTDPALGGEASGVAVIGEIARITRRQGAWTHVSLDGDREGWIESSNFASLERGAGVE
jgi:hypothetical protein